MNSRLGTLTADDLTADEQWGPDAHRLGALVHDCELLPPTWGPHQARPAESSAAPVSIDALIEQIRALRDDAGDL